MKTARQRVFEFIQIHQQATAADISKSLVMTRANARHHLVILIRQGLVQELGTRPSKKKGRPAILYGLSRHSLGENFDHLADAVIAVLEGFPEECTPERLYKQIALQMIKNSQEMEFSRTQKKPDSHVTTRLGNAIQRLNYWRYHARWEAHSEAPHVILGNCPYLSILSSHPELCEMDRELIELLVGFPTQLLANREPDERGLLSCRFRLIQQD